MIDIVNSLLPYKLDIYSQVDDQDELTGALVKTWQYIDTLSCSAKSTISNSATSRSAADKQNMSSRYKYDQFIEIRTKEKLNIRHKISNIRTLSGEVLWAELDYPTETPTVFEIVGVSPISDPLTGVMMYNTTAKRSENQQIDI